MTAWPGMRPIGAVMGFVAATLGVMSALHLGGVLTGENEPFDPSHASIAEAVICVTVAIGAVAALRGSARARAAALGATLFAIVGFVVGLNFTVRGGDDVDIAYHATVLPLLLLVAMALMLRPTPR